MHCQDCPRYDLEREACRDGKLNPARWDQAIDVVRLFGLRSVCVFNDHRERLVNAHSPGPRQAGDMPRHKP